MCTHTLTDLVTGIYTDTEAPISGAWLGFQCLICGEVLDQDPDADTLAAWIAGEITVPEVDQVTWNAATDAVVQAIRREMLPGTRRQEVGQLLARRDSQPKRRGTWTAMR